MRHYLLETNVVSSLMRYPRSRLLERLAEVGEDHIYTAVIVAAELRFGASKVRSTRMMREVEARLDRLDIASFEHPADRVYADLRAELERAGTSIGANDLWIAAQALHDGSVLVSNNVREFGRVPDLMVENWLRA